MRRADAQKSRRPTRKVHDMGEYPMRAFSDLYRRSGAIGGAAPGMESVAVSGLPTPESHPIHLRGAPNPVIRWRNVADDTDLSRGAWLGLRQHISQLPGRRCLTAGRTASSSWSACTRRTSSLRPFMLGPLVGGERHQERANEARVSDRRGDRLS